MKEPRSDTIEADDYGKSDLDLDFSPDLAFSTYSHQFHSQRAHNEMGRVLEIYQVLSCEGSFPRVFKASITGDHS